MELWSSSLRLHPAPRLAPAPAPTRAFGLGLTHVQFKTLAYTPFHLEWPCAAKEIQAQVAGTSPDPGLSPRYWDRLDQRSQTVGPAGQSQLCLAHELRMGFVFLKECKVKDRGSMWPAMPTILCGKSFTFRRDFADPWFTLFSAGDSAGGCPPRLSITNQKPHGVLCCSRRPQQAL